MVLHAIDSVSNQVTVVKLTNNKIHVKASELESKLDTINTSLGSLTVSVGDVTVNTGDLEVLGAATNTKLDFLIAANHTDLDSIDITLASVVGAVDGLEGKTDDTNTKLDSLISANHTDLAVIATNTSSMALNRTANAFMTSVSLASFAQHSSSIDNVAHKHVDIVGSGTTSDSLFVMGSHDNLSWFPLKECYPMYFNSTDTFHEHVENSPRYISIAAGSSGGTYTVSIEQQKL